MTRPVRKKLLPATTGDLEANSVINPEIAFYNRTGNMLALWAVVDICDSRGLSLPSDVQEVFADIGRKMVGHSMDGTIGARDEAADLVLGTRNSSGGSPFKDYATYKSHRAIIRRVRELLLQDVKARRTPGGPSSHGAQTRIYNAVADEFDKDPDLIKRLFEEDDRAAEAFGYRVLTRKFDGVADV